MYNESILDFGNFSLDKNSVKFLSIIFDLSIDIINKN